MPQSRQSNETAALLRRAADGDGQALADLFEQHRARLEVMVRLRLDRRLQGRLDPADVLQEAYLDVARRFGEYLATDGALPFFLWLRLLTGQKLAELHRRHLGAKMRNAGLEVSLHHGKLPSASSASLAELLLGRLTSASRAAIRAETRFQVQEALNSMDSMDREVLILRHFEMLSNEEAAQVLGIKPSAASNRHVRALRRLEECLAQVSSLIDVTDGR
jgi:RNA polymerase sigma-70 factor, ECF subfamily